MKLEEYDSLTLAKRNAYFKDKPDAYILVAFMAETGSPSYGRSDFYKAVRTKAGYGRSLEIDPSRTLPQHADILLAAALSEEFIAKISPTRYMLTDKGKDFYQATIKPELEAYLSGKASVDTSQQNASARIAEAESTPKESDSDKPWASLMSMAKKYAETMFPPEDDKPKSPHK